MRTPRLVLIFCMAAGLLAAPAAAATSLSGAPGAAPPATGTAAPLLVSVRASSHVGYDRVVWEFRGGLPNHRLARYVPRLLGDASGLPIRIAGDAILQVSMFDANAHNPVTNRLTAPARLVVGLPNVIELVQSGDFEAHVSYGVGLARRQTFRLFTLTRPSRVVLDVRKAYTQADRKVVFQDLPRFIAGTTPYTRAVRRTVPASTPASAVLHHLFAGPTASERAAGLRTVRSGATGFDRLSISAGVARIRLLGGCSSGGSTFTIANLVRPTLKQFSTVRFVKIYDPAGRTERATGLSDSIPTCLEP